MALRWLSPRQAAWGQVGSERVFSLQSVVIIGFVLALAGGAFGYSVSGAKPAVKTRATPNGVSTDQSGDGASSENSKSSSTPAKADAKTSAVIAPDVALFAQTERSPDGAAKAATAFISGISNVAFVDSDRQVQVLDDIVSSTASPSVRQSLVDNLSEIKTSLQTAPGSNQARARLIVTPASYKVDSPSPEQATVNIWYMSVLIDATSQTVRSYWATTTFGLEWSQHWRLNKFETKLGPAPQIYAKDAQFSSFADVRQVFDGYKAYRYATASQ